MTFFVFTGIIITKERKKKMKFVHMADLHLDTPFTSLNEVEGLGEKRRLEQRKVVKEIVEYIQKEDIPYFFIAGDLYEEGYARESTISYINGLFQTIPNTKIYITPGNHDPYLKNSFYQTYPWSPNVHIFTEKLEKIEEPECSIYGFGFNDFYRFQNPISELKLEHPEKINICITHGSLEGGTEDRQYNPMTKGELKRIGFDYVALGHIHKTNYGEEENQTIFYPGSTIALGFDELGEHGILVGDITKTKKQIQFIRMDPKQYVELPIDISKDTSKEEVIEHIQSVSLEPQNLYKIVLVGTRNFEINTLELLKQIEVENIIKIKNKTKIQYNLETLQTENTLKGIFVRKVLEQKENYSEEYIQNVIEIGLDALTGRKE